MKQPSRVALQAVLLTILSGSGANAVAQRLDARFSCSEMREQDGAPVTYADTAEMRLTGGRIEAFRWESALFRSTHGFDCSIDEGDGLQAEVRDDAGDVTWRVMLLNARSARQARGFGFDRGLNCSIRLKRDGDMLNVQPSCPALCGSRANFSALSVNLKTGKCHYEE